MITIQVNYISYNGKELPQSAWCGMPYHEVRILCLPFGKEIIQGKIWLIMIGLFEQPATVPDRRRHRFLLPRPVFHCSLSLPQVRAFSAIFFIVFRIEHCFQKIKSLHLLLLLFVHRLLSVETICCAIPPEFRKPQSCSRNNIHRSRDIEYLHNFLRWNASNERVHWNFFHSKTNDDVVNEIIKLLLLNYQIIITQTVIVEGGSGP